ncbi:oxygen-insensitive NADPH nitroreductase [Staphylococcus argensis]|uniref:NADPH-dependent oxidoreductase n=1 Tax=Staphylococcus argensis TaxID=1607738 RepID=A0A2K4FB69_9STAP|nr:oxygen-insensitive NADPH nitroreductase [Staphylococcus argensis]MCY6991799.1 oxygen-insensitive NADPH nitroreductase [Staphylococcus argensis]POA08600.1 oxygen-insensitive NADPH nitroreductase [Staphylococcus argensis]
MGDYVYNLLTQHHSVRRFKDQPLPESDVQHIVEAGQAASTSSYLQTYSVIGIDDLQVKESLKEVSGQPYVEDNGYLFVFVMDYYRHSVMDDERQEDLEEAFGSTENLLVGSIDVALLAQNMAVTAEDMGYGIVYLGSLRNDVARVKEILDLPDYTFPLFGMAVGVPADNENGSPKPRLPFEAVFHKNKYIHDKTQHRQLLRRYDQTVSDYYRQRTNGERTETWSNQVINFMSTKQRLDMLDELNKSGFVKK